MNTLPDKHADPVMLTAFKWAVVASVLSGQPIIVAIVATFGLLFVLITVE